MFDGRNGANQWAASAGRVRWMALLVAGCLAVGALTACGGSGRSAEAATTRAPARRATATLPGASPTPMEVEAGSTIATSAKTSAVDAPIPPQAPVEGSSLCATVSKMSDTSATEPSGQMPVVTYDAGTNTIVVRPGAPATLKTIGVAMYAIQPGALRELQPGEWLLGANLRVDSGASLQIAAPEVRWLKLRSDGGVNVWIKAMGGQLAFSGVCVTSWDTVRQACDENVEDGRSFVLARNGAQMDIRGSELSYLGYDANESYGVAWRMAGTRGEIVNSRFGHNFYGLYFYSASDIVIRGNEVHHSARYGIDAHTGSNRLLIENNVSHHNGKQGIILAEGCSDSTIRGNTVYSNSLHGIVIYQGSNNNVVEGNVSFGNELQGINVNGASHNTIRGNVVEGNAEAGIGLGQDATDNVVTGNTARLSQDGIYVYSNAQRNVLGGNRVSANQRYGIYIKSENNQIAPGNQVFGNGVGVYLNVANSSGVLHPDNQIHDNRDANVRVRGS